MSDTPRRTFRLHQVRLPPGEVPEDLAPIAARHLGIDVERVLAARLVKQSLDARRGTPRWVLTVEAAVGADTPGLERATQHPSVREVHGDASSAGAVPKARLGRRPIVVGAGPAGLFAALALARKGYEPLLVDRGKDVRRRWRDVRDYWRRGDLDPESNVAFGEGGAGTFSDGKVYTRRNDPRNDFILETLARAADAPDILTAARPHLGTNRLSRALLALRPELEDAGVTFLFDTQLRSIEVRDGRVVAVDLGRSRVETDAVFLGTGHSARDVHRLLLEAGVVLEARPFAIGARVEHPQSLIDAAQYGDASVAGEYGAATYELSHHDRRQDVSAHTFCTCPGGEIVAASTEPDGLTVNGMSYSHRGQPYCNSAVIVEVTPEELGRSELVPRELGNDDPLVGVAFQRTLETRAAELGGGRQAAPGQRVADFLAGTPSSGDLESSYRLGVRGRDLTAVLPPKVVGGMQSALRAFGRRLPGFDREGLLVAVEARTTSPVRVVRDRDTFQSVSTAGLFPIGEGAGFAGGIVSAASDGLRAVERVATRGRS